MNLLAEAITPLKPFTISISGEVAWEEKDNKKTLAYCVPGIKVKCDEIYVNKTMSMSLHFYGEASILNSHSELDVTINVDTNIYDKYDWHVSNGILYVVLYEKINKRPKFTRVEKSKKVKEEVIK